MSVPLLLCFTHNLVLSRFPMTCEGCRNSDGGQRVDMKNRLTREIVQVSL